MNNELTMPMMQEEGSLKRILKNQKGLTLIELLAVIVILGIIVAIAIPSIGNIIGNSKVKAQRANAHMVIDAARVYATNTGVTADVDVPLSTLASNGYLNGVPKDPFYSGATYDGTNSFVRLTVGANEAITYSIFVRAANSGTIYFGTAGTPVVPIPEDSIDSTTPTK